MMLKGQKALSQRILACYITKAADQFFLQGMHELTVRLGHYISTNIHYYVDDHEGES